MMNWLLDEGGGGAGKEAEMEKKSSAKKKWFNANFMRYTFPQALAPVAILVSESQSALHSHI